MANLGNKRRRCFGVICLMIAVGMLVAGQTVFEPILFGRRFLVYWLVCFLFTFFAILTAFSEWLAVRLQAREEQRNLLKQTLTEVEHEAEARHADSSLRPDEAD